MSKVLGYGYRTDSPQAAWASHARHERLNGHGTWENENACCKRGGLRISEFIGYTL